VPCHRGPQASNSSSYWQEAQHREATPHSVGESTSSPGAIVAGRDSDSSSDDSFDIPSIPGSASDQFRSGPFGHIFYGMRLTTQERCFLEDLTQYDTTNTPGPKHRAPAAAHIVQTLSQITYADFFNHNFKPVLEPGNQDNTDVLPIATERVSVSVPLLGGDDDDSTRRESSNFNIHAGTEPPNVHQRTGPDDDRILLVKGRDYSPGLNPLAESKFETRIVSC
jgi:hypothetical protein